MIGTVGKTSLLLAYTTNSFPEEYVPTIFDNHRMNVQWEDRTVSLDLYDTAGQEDYDKLRPMSYPGTHVFLICFALSERSTFANIDYKWIPELRKHQVSDIPFILVGTKCDLAVEASKQVTDDEIKKLVEKIGAPTTIKCSAKTSHNLKQVFDTAIHLVMRPQDFGVSDKKKSNNGANSGNGGGKSCCVLC
jgi:Ras-related C3 botulinum toxin substrate 1